MTGGEWEKVEEMYQGRKPSRVGLLYLVCLCGPE